MAHDYDDNILLDSDVESNIKSRKSKASDFIPKPRILTAPASKIVSIAHAQRNSTDDPSKHNAASSNDNAERRGHGSLRLSTENIDDPNGGGASPIRDSKHGSPSNSLPRVHLAVAESGDSTPPAVLEPSTVHLVEHPPIPSAAEVKAEEGTYKRLISDSPSLEEQTDVEKRKSESSCLCRVIKNPTIRRNWKVYMGSLILTLLGLGLIILGVIIGYGTKYSLDLKYLIFIVGGILLLVPGSYHLVFMTLAACDVPGFKFSKLPTIR